MFSMTHAAARGELDDQHAYELALSLAATVPHGELVHINVDVRGVASDVLTRDERLGELAEQARHLLPGHPQADFQALPVLARALRYAEALTVTAVPLPDPAPELLAALAHDRALLAADLAALVVRGLLPALPRRAQGGPGARGLVAHVIHLVVHLRNHPGAWVGHPYLSAAALKAAEGRAEAAARVLATRAALKAQVEATRLTRARIYTLFVRALKSVTRAAAYLHPERVDDYVPSLFERSVRARRRKGAKRATASLPAPKP
jgi:hypothetical protein